jgi:succinate dehydrogenase/fumarate reductase flavoprotein subunit
MTQDKSSFKDSRVSRRNFLGTAAIGAAAIGGTALAASALKPNFASAALGAQSAKGIAEVRGDGKVSRVVSRAAPLPVPSNWSQVADVVIVGYGGAGAVTAITAYDAGANVLVLEKTPSYASLGVTNPAITGGGGSTSMNAGNATYVKDPLNGANYIYQQSWGNTPMAVCESLAWMEVENPAWLTQMGIKYTLSSTTGEFPTLPGGALGFGGMSLASGNVFFQQLDALVQKRNIPILFNTPATDLFQDPTTGEILGVQALANNSEVLNIQAKKAVVLTTGSIEYNETMKSDNMRVYPAHFYGWQFCTGDSVTMASKVGAAMWHMGAMSARMVPWFPQYPIAFGTCAPGQHGWIYVDKNGNRYADETEISTYSHNWWIKLSDFDLTVPQYTRIPSFIIFDETCRKAAAITSGSNGQLPVYLDPRPVWSSDNSAEITRGWIQSGKDIPTLVAAMNSTAYVGMTPGTNNYSPAANTAVNINPATLQATLNNYNGFCTAGVDTQFGRPKSALIPIVTPPFYAMPLWPGGPSAFGGPVRNEKGQICDADNNPIPRLYTAGESGSTDGMLSLGANNAQIIAFGRISGSNAASENPWA